MTSDLGRYLGMPTINGRVSKLTLQSEIDRIDKHLIGWRRKSLSLVGHAPLVSSSLSTIPFYAMQTSKLPRSVYDECDKKACLFLWGGDANNQRIHGVS